MDTIIRAAAVYFILLIVLRFAGPRTLAQATTFDLVLLLVIAEATQQALTGVDDSITTAALVIVTLVFLDVLFSLLKRDLPFFGKLIDGTPVVLVEDGRLLRQRMKWARVSEADVLLAARTEHGIYQLERIKFAILEANGKISIIPHPNMR